MADAVRTFNASDYHVLNELTAFLLCCYLNFSMLYELDYAAFLQFVNELDLTYAYGSKQILDLSDMLYRTSI